jgi:hypothetical protein
VKIPTLTKLTETASRTTWKAEFPSVPRGQSALYRVTTYPKSDLIYVASWGRDRRVTGARLLEQIRAGLRHAQTAA